MRVYPVVTFFGYLISQEVKIMKALPLLFSAILVITMSAYADVSDYYIYPAGTKPTGIPPASPTIAHIELAGWADAAVDGNALPRVHAGSYELRSTKYKPITDN